MSTNFNLDTNPNDISQEDFASFFDDYLNQRSIREQSVVPGQVIGIEGDWVTVDVGYKAEGIISKNQFLNEEGELTISVGDTIDVYLDTMHEDEGQLILSKEKADQMKAWEEISKAYENNEIVTGQITQRVKGGLSVDIGV